MHRIKQRKEHCFTQTVSDDEDDKYDSEIFHDRMPSKKLVQADELPKGIHTVKITLKSGKNARIRVVKFDLPSGETETLVTDFYLRKMTVEDYEIKQSVVPIRPDRSVPRPSAPRDMKFYHNKKNNS